MSTVQELFEKMTTMLAQATSIQNDLGAVNLNIQAADLKLDEVLVFIQGLQAGQLITQQQIEDLNAAGQAAIDALATATASAQSAVSGTQAVLSEADTLDGTP